MSNNPDPVLPVAAAEVAPRARRSNYPAPFAAKMEGRTKRVLGDRFGLRAFGVNLTTLAPRAVSALHHRHSGRDEFVYVVAGRPTVVLGECEVQLEPGMCVGFPAGGPAHHLHNRTREAAVYLEVGDRAADDRVEYPADDLRAEMTPGGWVFTRKEGRPW